MYLVKCNIIYYELFYYLCIDFLIIKCYKSLVSAKYSPVGRYQVKDGGEYSELYVQEDVCDNGGGDGRYTSSNSLSYLTRTRSTQTRVINKYS